MEYTEEADLMRGDAPGGRPWWQELRHQASLRVQCHRKKSSPSNKCLATSPEDAFAEIV